MKTSPHYPRRAFTLIELLVVITIIAILAGVTLAAFNGVRKRASRTAAVAAMRTIGQMVEVYAGDNDGYYPPGEGEESLIGAVQTAAVRDESNLAYYLNEMLVENEDTTESERAKEKIFKEMVPKFVLPFLEDGEEDRELYYIFHVDIEDEDPLPGAASNPAKSVWGKKGVAINFSKASVPMLSDIYLGSKWEDFKTEETQTLWGKTFNVLYYNGSVATLREDDFDWAVSIPKNGAG
jgi:prepilin-type N-terminal cleavage/methylation domain-containing protein